MADNLNVTNDPQSGDANSPINNAPTKSPLEQSTPVQPMPVQDASPTLDSTAAPAVENPPSSPFPADATPPVSQSPLPAEPSVPEVAQQPSPVEVPASSIPPINNPDMGESAPAPDTDEFLKSILQEQPQPTTDVQPEVNLTTQDTMPGEGLPVNSPIQEPTPITDVNTPTGSSVPNLNDKPIDQLTGEAQPVQPAMEPAAPGAMPEVNYNSGQKLTDNVTLDGANISQSQTPAPEPPQVNPDVPVSSGVFAGGEPPKGSPLKKVILIVLVLVVAAGGYYAYTALFGSSSTSKTTSTLTSKTAVTGVAGTSISSTDSQRKTDLIKIQQALLDYSAGNSGQYPISTSFTFLNQSGNLLEKELVPTYLSKLPEDPTASKSYAYKSDGLTFTLTAELDNADDPDVIMNSGKALYQVTSSTVSSGSTGATTATTATASSSLVSSSGSTVTAQVSSSVASVPPVPAAP